MSETLRRETSTKTESWMGLIKPPLLSVFTSDLIGNYPINTQSGGESHMERFGYTSNIPNLCPLSDLKQQQRVCISL